MASKNKIYVVTMYRWGSRENHSYLLGVWSKKQKAFDECDKEEEYRGGNKYFGEVIEMDPNSGIRDDAKRFKVVRELEKPIFN